MPQCAFLGRSTLDLLYLVSGYPQENTKVFASDFVQQAGGPALNAAVAFAQLGGEATLYSAVGETTASRAIKEELSAYHVRLQDIAEPEYAPPVAVALVNSANGSRTVWNPPLCEPPVSGATDVQLRQPMALIDGFLFPAFRKTLEDFAANGGTICLDGGSWKPQTPDILPLTSIAICSERFAAPGTRTPEEVMDFLHGQGIAKVAITRGGESILGSDNGRRFEFQVEKVHAVDTLGAGDILHGAFCWYHQQSSDFCHALEQASRVATVSCQSLGARRWVERFRTL